MKPSFTFSILIVAAFVAGTQAASCLEKSTTFSKLATEAQATCLTTLNLTAADIPTGKDLKEKHFNDKCMSSCVLQSMKLYNNGTILKDVLLEGLKKEVASDVYDKLAKTVEKCVEKATAKPTKKDKDENDKKMTTGTPRTRDFKIHQHKHGNVTCQCRRAAKFVYCMLEKDKEAEC